MAEAPWVVLKFGGTSVRDRQCWERILQVLALRFEQGMRPFIVLSAPRGVSDNLAAIARQDNVEFKVGAVKQVYKELVAALDLTSQLDWSDFFAPLDTAVAELLNSKPIEKAQAAVLACGELLLSRLAVKFLQQQGLSTMYLDERQYLHNDPSIRTDAVQYLKSYCPIETDAKLQVFLEQNPCQVVVTQGFIASNADGETVLLGRGGSDTSAAYFAAKLQAVRCEIWTDVAGIYTANPSVIPEARLLPRLDYDEAQEIALMGGKVLHPESLNPVMKYNIPMHIRSSYDLDVSGTIITNDISYRATSIKSIISKKGVVLIKMTAFAMWKQAGFLAQVFAIFKKFDVSYLVSRLKKTSSWLQNTKGITPNCKHHS